MSGASSMHAAHQANLPNRLEIRCITWWQSSDCHVRCGMHRVRIPVDKPIFRNVWKFNIKIYLRACPKLFGIMFLQCITYMYGI